MPSMLSMRDLFPEPRPIFEMSIDTEHHPRDVCLDVLDWGDFATWVPVLGPSPILLYAGVLHAGLNDDGDGPLLIDPIEAGANIGLQDEPARKAWFRLVVKGVMTQNTHGTYVVPRFLPTLPYNEERRRTPQWRAWYRDYIEFRRNEQGIQR